MMGFNTVVVIYNDRLHEIEESGPLGARLADAVRAFGFDRQGDGYFGAGKVVSLAHADYDQVVVVGQNRGRPIQEAENLSYLALDAMADCLRRHGWTESAPKRKPRGRRAALATLPEPEKEAGE